MQVCNEIFHLLMNIKRQIKKSTPEIFIYLSATYSSFLSCLYGRIQEGRCCNGRREVSCNDKAVYEQGCYSLCSGSRGVDLEAYKDQLIERFSNKAISDQVSRLCGDGIAKFAVYVVPILKQMLQDGKDISIEAFLIAVYCKYLIGARTESGENIAISEPHITRRTGS